MRYIEDAAGHLHRLRVLRRMTPEQRLVAALELSEWTRALFAEGLRRRFPDLSEQDFQAIFRQRLALCYSRSS